MILKYNFYTICWAIIILIVSIVNVGTNANIEIHVIDKIVHTGMYGLLALLMIVGFLKQRSSNYIRFNAIRLSVIITTMYGISIEIVQSFIPERGFDWVDMIANTIGAFIGFGLFVLIYKL